MSERAFLVNVGLPRTGTTSFHLAAQRIGLNSLHPWKSALYTPAAATAPADNPHRMPELNTTLWERVLSGEPRGLGQAQALADLPFFLDRRRFAAAYPRARFVCSTRSVESWVASMIKYRGGGSLYLARRYGLADLLPYSDTPETRRRPCGRVGVAPRRRVPRRAAY